MSEAAKNKLPSFQEEYDMLCFELFQQLPKGQRFLQMLIQKHFYAPVANTNAPIGMARFLEGHNELIRSFIQGINRTMNPELTKPKTVDRKRNL